MTSILNGLVISHQGNTVLVETNDEKNTLCTVPRKIERPTCGDVVQWKKTGDESGSIIDIEPRKNILSRPNPRGGERIIATNLDRILVVLAVEPVFQEALIDRYLIAAAYFDIPATLVLNKVDLVDNDGLFALNQRIKIYKEIGYQIITASTKNTKGLDSLKNLMSEGNSILVGQSGVGKSSLIKALIPELDISIGAISEATKLGKHTTSSTVLYHLPEGGHIVDSPGVRDFGLWHLAAEDIAPGYREFADKISDCRFRNCTHLREPGCAVIKAVKKGKIKKQRYESFKAIMGQLEKMK